MDNEGMWKRIAAALCLLIGVAIVMNPMLIFAAGGHIIMILMATTCGNIVCRIFFGKSIKDFLKDGSKKSE